MHKKRRISLIRPSSKNPFSHAHLVAGGLIAVFTFGCNTLSILTKSAPLPRPPAVSQVAGETKEWGNAPGIFYSQNIHYVVDVTLGFGNSLEVSSDGAPVPKIDLTDPVMDSTESQENALVSRNGVYRVRELENDINTKRQVLRLEFYPRTWPLWRNNFDLAHARPFDLSLIERSINPQVASTAAERSPPTKICNLMAKTVNQH